jgi:hypothetical protein
MATFVLGLAFLPVLPDRIGTHSHLTTFQTCVAALFFMARTYHNNPNHALLSYPQRNGWHQVKGITYPFYPHVDK